MNNENFLPLLCFRFRWAGSDTVTSTSWRSVDTRTRPTSGSALSRRVRPRTGRCRSNSRKPETPDCTNVRYPPSRTAANSFDWMSSVSFCLLPIISCCCLPAVRAISALIRFKTLLDVWKTQTMPLFLLLLPLFRIGPLLPIRLFHANFVGSSRRYSFNTATYNIYL